MVYILLAPGFEEAEALVPADLLRRGGVETALVSTDGAMVAGGRQITIKADLTLDQVELDRADMLVLPGGGVGVQKLGQDLLWRSWSGRRRSGGSLWPPSVRPLRCWAGGGCWTADGPSAIPAWRDR